MNQPEQLQRVLAYHQRTKHHMGRFARSLGYMDWDNQPDPFRRYLGAELIALDEVEPRESPAFDEVLQPGEVAPRPLDSSLISQLFYDALALSAWKEIRGVRPGTGSRWSLRCNPSSGNLHPTEATLITGPGAGLEGGAGVFHYTPFLHALERRAQLDPGLWSELRGDLPDSSVLVGLSSIHWREAWKYGERAFRYCQHDVGHAVAALSYAAAAMGWRARLLEGIGDDELAALLGIDGQRGPEREHPDVLIALAPATSGQALHEVAREWRPAPGALDQLSGLEWAGEPNQLSRSHHDWPIIDEVAEASRKPSGSIQEDWDAAAHLPRAPAPWGQAAREVGARRLFRQRRSAVDMDGRTWIDGADLFRALAAVMPEGGRPPLSALPWAPAIDLLLFVHRVRGVEPGLYVLVRHLDRLDTLRASMRERFAWERPEGCPDELPLYRLSAGDSRRAAQVISCDQEIASGGAFAVSMLAELEPRLEERGPWFYRRLFWEAGAVGQALYLEAEAAGVRATGIGCYFDDAMHELLGLDAGMRLQVLYHLTVGGPIDDSRLRTAPAYLHREAALRAASMG